MKQKFARIVLILCVTVFVAVGIFLALRYLSFFDIKSIEVGFTGPVKELDSRFSRIISPYKGVNLFSADLGRLKELLSSCEGVREVEIKRFFPSRLIITIRFMRPAARVFVTGQNGDSYFFADEDSLSPISEDTWKLFAEVLPLEVEEKYADYISKWSVDNGFVQMCVLTRSLTGNSLITGAKYYNNVSGDFGSLTLEMPDVESVLHVKEAVTPERLSEAIEYISREQGRAGEHLSSNGPAQYNLYAGTLVKHD